jgi:putative Holliday junction resolvase
MGLSNNKRGIPLPAHNTIGGVEEKGRILALDLGKKRIGLAISDELRVLAQGLETLDRKGRRADIEVLRRLTVQREVRTILLGDPRHMSGAVSEQAEYTREFAKELERKTCLPVILRDERLTSWEAAEILRERGASAPGQRGAIDQMSAVILLQGYLDELCSGQSRGDVTP